MSATTRLLAALVTAATLSAIAAPAMAQGVCEQLWVERNSIYKARGYCFKTQRAISYFGNAGCLYDVEAALPLSPYERARIAEIRRTEQVNGCR